MGIVTRKGSIFESGCQTIVNTVNCKGIMGKGLALEFRHRFHQMYIHYKRQCGAEKIRVGELTIWKQSRPWIINFPTKNHWKYPSRIKYIQDGLKFFVEHYERWGIQSIAFPKLGASHGKLHWPRVRKLMTRFLNELPIHIEIWEFEQGSKDSLFESLKRRLQLMDCAECKRLIGLRPHEAAVLSRAANEGSMQSFDDVKGLPGIGAKSMIKIYRFANSRKPSIQKTLA